MKNKLKKAKSERSDPFKSDEFQHWADDMRARLIPKMRDSASVLIALSKDGSKFDIEFAVQIGASILLGKPLLLLAPPGCTIPPKLLAIADRVINVNIEDPTMDSVDIQNQIQQAVIDFGKQ